MGSKRSVRSRQGSDNRAAIEIVAQGEDCDTEHRVDDLPAIMRNAERPGHHAKAEPANRSRHHKTMFNHAPTQSDNAEADGEEETHFVDGRIEKNAAGGSNHGENDRASETMNKAEPR